jgi:hypothetical protein
MGDVSPGLVYVTKKLTMPAERLVSGFLTVNVRHEMVGTVSDSGEVDCNWAYNQRWGDDPNNVEAHSDYPYVGEQPTYATTSTRQYTPYTDNSGDATTFTDATCDTNHTSNTTTVNHNANANIVVGLEVSGTGIPVGTTIVSITSTTAFVISNAATATNTNVTLTFAGPLTSLTQYDKKLSLGDFDCYLYFVTAAAHLEDGYHANTGERAIKDGEAYYSRLPADKCQSFVKSHLISRINNSAETDDGSGLEMYKRGAQREEYGFTTGNIGGQSATVTGTALPYSYLYSHGVYDNSNGFGIDMSLGNGNNTFFTPVYTISIGATHTTATSSGLVDLGSGYNNTDPSSAGNGSTRWYPEAIVHNKTEWELQVKIGLWAYLETSTYAYFKNRTNIFFQPFGETAALELL